MNREMRRLLAKQMKPMKDPIKEAQRVERASAMTKVLINQALGTVKEAVRVKWTSEITKDAVKEVFGIVKNVVPKPDITKKSRKFCGAVKGWILHKWK